MNIFTGWRFMRLAALAAAWLLILAESGRAAGSTNGWLLVANKGDRSLGIIDPVSNLQVAAIDTQREEVAQWVTLPGIAYGTDVTPDGRWLIAALPGFHVEGVEGQRADLGRQGRGWVGLGQIMGSS